MRRPKGDFFSLNRNLVYQNTKASSSFFFVWTAAQGTILTNDNLKKKKGITWVDWCYMRRCSGELVDFCYCTVILLMYCGAMFLASLEKTG